MSSAIQKTRLLDTERKAIEVIYGQTALTCRRQQSIVPDVLRHAVEDCERTGQSNQGTLGFVGALRVLEYDRREMDTGEVLRGIGLRGAGEASGPGGTLRACRIYRKALWQNETMISI